MKKSSRKKKITKPPLPGEAKEKPDRQSGSDAGLRQRAEELSLLYQINLALTGGQDLYHALRAFVKELKRVMVVDAFHVGFYDAQTDLFTYSLFLNLDEDLQVPPRSLRENPGLSWEVISGKQTVYLPDISDPETQREHSIVIVRDVGIRSYVGIPLMLQDRVMGVMSVQSLQPSAYNANQIRLLETLAAQVASTVEKGRLLDQLRQELDERKRVETSLRQRESILAGVSEAANRLLKAPDWKTEINSILMNLGKAINASHAYLFENHLQEDGTQVTSMRFEWTAPAHPTDLGATEYQAVLLKEPDFEEWYEVMSVGLPYLGDRQHAPPENIHFLQARGMKALLDVPIYVNGEWWGTIGFDDMDNSRVWSNAEVDALVVAANTLGAAIQRQQVEAELRTREQNYRALYETAQKQTQELALLGNVRNAMSQELDLPALLRSVVESVAESFGYALVSVYLIEDGELVLQHQVGYEHVIPKIALAEGVSGRVVFTGKPVFLEDVRTDLEFLGAVENIVSEICVPLFDEGRVAGVLNVESIQGVKLTQTDLKLLDALSQHIGIAIGRARLYTNVQRELEARKQAEIEREKLIAELAAKNAELERFTYTVSHDLKAPLFTIRGFLGYLEKDLLDGDRDQFQKDAQRIAEATGKMQQLLNDLLELSRVGRLMNEPGEIQMNELVQDVLALLQGQIQERGVVVQVQENLPRVYADRQRMTEVLQNLVDNAVKFTGAQTSPRVEIGQAGEENAMPIFFVRDNGIGIAHDHFERVFGLFNKLDPRSEGTGIGLALVRRIVEFHGGRIWVESEPGAGSTFFFTIPTQPTAFDQTQGKPDSVI
jgi:signal transduction histidine kinase